MCLDFPQHHIVLMCEVIQTLKKIKIKGEMDKCVKRQMLKVHSIPHPVCIPWGVGVPCILHRQSSFLKAVVNRVHSMQIAWNMHFLPHTWVRQRIQSSHQSGEIKPCCSSGNPLPRFGGLVLLLTQSGAVEMPPGSCNIPVSSMRGLQNISSILEFWWDTRRENPGYPSRKRSLILCLWGPHT